MKKYKSFLLPLLAPLFLSGIIEQNKKLNSLTESKWSGTISNARGAGEFPELNIADMWIVEGNAGQRIAEIMVTMPHKSARHRFPSNLQCFGIDRRILG